MTINDINIVPHSDSGSYEYDTMIKHDNLIKNNRYSDATTLLESENYDKGMRASLFNSVQNKIREFQIFLLNLFAEPNELYSMEEPTAEQMEGKDFWIKPY